MLSRISLLLVLLMSPLDVRAETGELPLWPDAPPGAPIPANNRETFRDGGVFNIHRPSYRVFHPTDSVSPHPAVIVFPGGGYGMLAMGWEGDPIATWLNGLGFTAIVVKYRVSSDPSDKYQHPVPLLDAQRAIRLTRHHASRWGIDPSKVGVIGFSAGGHLAATISNLHSAELHKKIDQIDHLDARPDFAVLVYPVISMQTGDGHDGSRLNLLGKSPSQDQIDALSMQRQVSSTTPPTFLVHGADDTVVPASDSSSYADALMEYNVPFELHIFEHGSHGFTLGGGSESLSLWPTLFTHWLKRHKITH